MFGGIDDQFCFKQPVARSITNEPKKCSEQPYQIDTKRRSLARVREGRTRWKAGLLSRDDAARTGQGFHLKRNEKVEPHGGGGVPRGVVVRACVCEKVGKINRSTVTSESRSGKQPGKMMKKEKPMMSVAAIIQGTQAQHWARGNAWLSLDNSNMSMSSVGPQSPLDMKPDTALINPGNFSPSGPNSPGPFNAGCHSNLLSTSPGGQSKTVTPYPPNHPLSGSKHLCSICGDRASGKHYGVYSCEGCKGFFKRTVRKDLSYACREEKSCIIDKRQRNRCQYCRYQKCLAMGMKREAVQEERQRTKERDQSEVESTSSLHADMPIERILEAEKRVECKMEHQGNYENAVSHICNATKQQLFQLVAWAKHIPHFTSLPVDDQVRLLKAGWNELLIAAFSHRSIEVKDSIILTTGTTVHRNSAQQAGVVTIFDRVLSELVLKMREMKMDRTELGCLRSIILFNPDVRGLKSIQEVSLLREKIYAALEEYTRVNCPEDPGRFAKLLLRLPSIRSIGLKCLEHLFFSKLIGEAPVENFITEMLESPSDP